MGQGREKVRNFLKDNPEIAAEIERKVKIKLGIVSAPAAEGGEEK